MKSLELKKYSFEISRGGQTQEFKGTYDELIDTAVNQTGNGIDVSEMEERLEILDTVTKAKKAHGKKKGNVIVQFENAVFKKMTVLVNELKFQAVAQDLIDFVKTVNRINKGENDD